MTFWTPRPPDDETIEASWYAEHAQPWTGMRRVPLRLLMPPAFESYVRIFHRAWPGDDPPIRWADLCRIAGLVAHPGMQWYAIGPEAARHVERLEQPYDGELLQPEWDALAAILSRHTRTPDHVVHCVWEGTFPSTAFRDQPRLTVPNRNYFVFMGDMSRLADHPRYGRRNSNVWWPVDRRWCVFSEIDAYSTYVGCTTACAREILLDGYLETATADLDDPVIGAPDAING